MSTLRTIELFAGVGGFRLGLEKCLSGECKYKIVWSNQWEPTTKVQHASEVYIKKFGSKNHSNVDIAKVKTQDIPDHDLLVGGFPCQDYSVAKILSQSKGIVGKKGVLWWEIHRIIKAKTPKYLFLENVDRLIKSPVNQRGRDFAIILKSLHSLGYEVEWRVIDASEYGMPQRRKRLFIFGYKKTSPMFKSLSKKDVETLLYKEGVFAKSFPILQSKAEISTRKLTEGLDAISKNFGKKDTSSFFENTGVIRGNKIYTVKTSPKHSGKKKILKDVLIDERRVPTDFYVEKADLAKWKYLKGSKKMIKVSKRGEKFVYSEGAMTFPDNLMRPSRTIVTAEGGRTPSRFKHVIKTKQGRHRRLTPVELERLSMFPDNHTLGYSDTRRAFFMGNALVVGIIKRFGKKLAEEHVKSK